MANQLVCLEVRGWVCCLLGFLLGVGLFVGEAREAIEARRVEKILGVTNNSEKISVFSRYYSCFLGIFTNPITQYNRKENVSKHKPHHDEAIPLLPPPPGHHSTNLHRSLRHTIRHVNLPQIIQP